MNRTLAGGNALKAFGFTRSRNRLSVWFSVLLDHLIRPRQHVGRNRQANLFGSFQIDDEFKLHRLFDWQVSRSSALQNFVGICGGAAVQVGLVRPIGHETSRIDGLPVRVHRGSRLFVAKETIWLLIPTKGAAITRRAPTR